MNINKSQDYSVKNIREQFKKQGIFYTPPELALQLKSYVDIETDEVYDLTCGHGSLLEIFGDEVRKYGQDINEKAIAYAKEHLKNFEGYVGDTLQDDKFKGRTFKVILGNPPFSVKYEPEGLENDERFKDLPCLAPRSKGDYMFIAHALHHLKEDGVAVLLNFPGILYRSHAEGRIRQWLIEQNVIDKVIHIEGKRFEDTNVATVVLVLKKNRKKTSVTFIDDEHKLEREVPLEEIVENHFNLSVSTYIEKPVHKEEIDIHALENKCVALSLANLHRGIQLSRLHHQLQGTDASFLKPIYHQAVEDAFNAPL